MAKKLAKAELSKNVSDTIHKLRDHPGAKDMILALSASFYSVRRIVSEIQSTYGVSVTDSNIHAYQNRYRREITTTRENWLDRLADEPLAHKRKRLNSLQELYQMAQDSYLQAETDSAKATFIKRMADIIAQARIEMEGNRITFQGQMLHKTDDADLESRVAGILQLRQAAATDSRAEDAEYVDVSG